MEKINLLKKNKYNLNLQEFLLLEFLVDNPNFFDDSEFSHEYQNCITTLMNLEMRGYLRRLGDPVIVLTDKAIDLFTDKKDGPGKEVLEYFNKLKEKYFNTKRPLKYQTYKSIILARLIDYNTDTIKKTLDYMFSKWYGTDMQQYLHPDTLFRASKMPKYVEDMERTLMISKDITEML
jgi:uncharacterized phage protein (TIGR02220 family)